MLNSAVTISVIENVALKVIAAASPTDSSLSDSESSTTVVIQRENL